MWLSTCSLNCTMQVDIDIELTVLVCLYFGQLTDLCPHSLRNVEESMFCLLKVLLWLCFLELMQSITFA